MHLGTAVSSGRRADRRYRLCSVLVLTLLAMLRKRTKLLEQENKRSTSGTPTRSPEAHATTRSWSTPPREIHHDFTADAPNVLWLNDITEQQA